ncbi:MAG TPA: N-acetylmuramoyl-L-alanine amidase [Granulicella sp.]
MLALPNLVAAQSMPYISRNVILLDPAHGGQDNGAAIGSQPEKNITLSLSDTLKSLLTARGFTVATTRDGDPPAGAPALTFDQRAGTANHLRPAACILLHVTSSGFGVHLVTSALDPSVSPYEPSVPQPWDTAQAFYIPQSRSLANDLGLALEHAKLPVVLLHAAVRPLDNLTCPALAVELAPLARSGQRPLPPSDSLYQQRLATALADALVAWRDENLPKPAPPAPKPAGVTP